MNKFNDFAMKCFFALIVGLCSLISKVLMDIENNIKELTVRVSLISYNSEKQEKQLDSFNTYSLVLQRIESQLLFHEKQIQALQSK